MTTLPLAYTVTRRRIPEEVIRGKRLGRHYHLDSRSEWYAYKNRRLPLEAVLHDRRIPILNQGNAGSCTGNAETGALGTDPLFAYLPTTLNLNEAEAIRLYSAAEVIDGNGAYPPNDDGSSGTSVCQAAVNANLISGYTHVTSVNDMADALQTVPVIVGVNWYGSFDAPDSSGRVTISPGAQVRGGHEFLVRGVDPVAMAFSADNSWGPKWGNKGSFTLSYDTMAQLLAEDGDCTVSVPLGSPPPVPAPLAPVVAEPGDDPDLVYGTDPKMVTWARLHHIAGNAYAARAYAEWRQGKGY